MIARVPLILEPQPEGVYTVTSPLLPELITEGDTITEALYNAQDAFEAVVELYEDFNRVLPSELFVEHPNGILCVDILSASPIASAPPIPECANSDASTSSPVIAKVPLILYPQPEGGYTVESPALREFLSDADTVREAQHNAQDAFETVVEMYEHFNDTLPESIFLKNPDGPLNAEILVEVPVMASVPASVS